MAFPRLFLLTGILVVGCVDSNESRVSGLAPDQKPEGFLMAVNIQPDPQVVDSYTVVCATSNGPILQEKRTRAQIERNELCKPVLSTSASTATPSPGGAQAGPVKLVLNTKMSTESFIKFAPNLNISKDKSSFQELVQYCLVPTSFSPESICKYSEIEYRVTNSNISGCLINPGYLYSAHFILEPATASIPGCK